MESLDPFSDSSSIAHRLDFTPGHAFRSKIRDHFSTPVNPISSSHGFSMIVSFGRASFELSPINVSISLSACLGAAFDELRVVQIKDRVFMFDVCSKAVGFLIVKMRSHISDAFVCYFDLWGFGDPNWQREELLWYQERDREWISVRGKKKNLSITPPLISSKRRTNISYLHAASSRVYQRKTLLTGANMIELGTRSGMTPQRSANCSEDRDPRIPVPDGPVSDDRDP